MTEIILRKRAARAGEIGLFSVDDEGAELIHKLKDGRDVGADVVQRRNPRHHRLAFALFKFVKMHCELFSDASIEEIKDAVKLATGWVRRYVDADTCQVFYVCKSISWAACDQTEFNQFFDAAVNVITRKWMPLGTLSEDVRRELLLMVDGEHAIGRVA